MYIAIGFNVCKSIFRNLYLYLIDNVIAPSPVATNGL